MCARGERCVSQEKKDEESIFWVVVGEKEGLICFSFSGQTQDWTGPVKPYCSSRGLLFLRFTRVTDTRSGKGEKLTGKSVIAPWLLCLVLVVLRGSPQGLQVGFPGADSFFITSTPVLCVCQLIRNPTMKHHRCSPFFLSPPYPPVLNLFCGWIKRELY